MLLIRKTIEIRINEGPNLYQLCDEIGDSLDGGLDAIKDSLVAKFPDVGIVVEVSE